MRSKRGSSGQATGEAPWQMKAARSPGTEDKHYNLIWFVEQSLTNASRLETCIEDAARDGDSDLADFFRRAQGFSRKDGEQGGRTCCASDSPA